MRRPTLSSKHLTHDYLEAINERPIDMKAGWLAVGP